MDFGIEVRSGGYFIVDQENIGTVLGGSEDVLLSHIRTLEKPGQYEEMLEVAERVIELDPGSAEALAWKARALQKLERISEATIANDQALLLDTNLPLAWINRSGLQILQERFPDGLRSAIRATELTPKDARAWANKGMALYNLNNLLGALAAFNQSLACDPDFLFSLRIKGEILRRFGRLHELAETMRHAIEIDPTDVVSLGLMTQALRALEEYTELPPITKRLTELTPDSPFAWDSHMRTLRALGRFEEASEAIDRLLELIADDEQLWTIKADNLYRLERYREAALAAEQALHYNQQYAPARRIHEKAVRLMYQRKGKRGR